MIEGFTGAVMGRILNILADIDECNSMVQETTSNLIAFTLFSSGSTLL